MCLIVHFAAFAFTDNAFHFDLVNAELTPYNMHDFCSPSDRIIIDFNFCDDILNVSIFCHFKQNLKNINVDSIKALSASFIAH